MAEEQKQTITPSQYFDYLKGAKQTVTTEALKASYETFIALGEKYEKLGQAEAMKRLVFLVETLIKEEKLIELGINTYIYKDVIEDYIDHVADKTVKIVELSRYMREVPDELVETVSKTKELFDEFYVIFTDYTGKEERKVQKERRDKDPILFGVFKNSRSVADRFYFLGDWVDEYCDLTLDKLVEEYKAKKDGKEPTFEVEIPQNAEELLAILKSYKVKEKDNESFIISANGMDIPATPFVRSEEEQKPGFFKKVRNVFKKKPEEKK